LDVPVNMTVRASSDLVITTAPFVSGALPIGGQTAVGASASTTTTLTNLGSTQLTVTPAASSNGNFTWTTATALIGPNGSVELPLTFAPQGPGAASTTLTLAANDSTQLSTAIPLSGTGVDAPFIDLANWDGTTTQHHALAPALGAVATTKRLSMPINDYADGILHWTAEPLFIPTGGGGSPAALRTAVFDPPGENLKFGPTQNRDYRWAD